MPRKLMNNLTDIDEDWEFRFLGNQKLLHVIALTGPTKCGKTIIGKRIATEHGFHYVSVSTILNETARKLGETNINWRTLGEVAKVMRTLKGPDVLARIIFKHVVQISRLHNRVVIDSLLHPREVEYLAQRCNLLLVGVVAERSVRVQQFVQWYEVTEEEALRTITERDGAEQFEADRGDENCPQVSKALTMVKAPDSLINITRTMSANSIFQPIDALVLSFLAGERPLQSWSRPIY